MVTSQEVLDFYKQLKWPIVHQREDESFFWLMDDVELLECTTYGEDPFVSVQYDDSTLRLKVAELADDGIRTDTGVLVKVMTLAEAEKIAEEKRSEAEADQDSEEADSNTDED